MSKYNAKEVSEMAGHAKKAGIPKTAAMLRDLARRLRQEEDENRRDPVTEPRPGDRVEICGNKAQIYSRDAVQILYPEQWARLCVQSGATIIRRREVQQ